jgi:alanine racemase
MALRAVARVDVGAIERNCARLAAVAAPARLCAVVKADGYGHGAVPAARAALAGGASRLAVATAAEAQQLRAGGIAAPVLVLGAVSEDELDLLLAARADVAAWREDFVRLLSERAGVHPVGVHVKLDSGMGRLGTRDAAEATRVAELADERAGVRLAGAMTHFATADEDDPSFLHEQLSVFTPWARAVSERHPALVVHAANSAATLREPAARFGMVRCGIAIYGLDPFNADAGAQGLEPALSLRSYVAEVKRCAPGQSAGYGRRFIATEETWLGTIPIGYGDGVRRALTNNADVLVDGRRVPLVGTVSMDNITVDLGSDPVPRGAEAVLIGPGLPAEEMAARLETLNYEVTCGISARVPRQHHRTGPAGRLPGHAAHPGGSPPVRPAGPPSSHPTGPTGGGA